MTLQLCDHGRAQLNTGRLVASSLKTSTSREYQVIAIYLELTSLKSVSSMKLHRDIGVRQATAWFMLHRIREAWKVPGGNSFAGPVEVDETFVGGKARNMHAHKRKQVIKGRGSVGKTAVVGAKDRATQPRERRWVWRLAVC